MSDAAECEGSMECAFWVALCGVREGRSVEYVEKHVVRHR